MARRAVGLIRRLIAALVAFVLAWEMPRIWSHEPLDHIHLEDASQIQDNRPQVEQAPPPVVVPSPAAWTPVSHYPFTRPYRRHPSYYTTPPDNTAVIWYAAEQAKTNTAA